MTSLPAGLTEAMVEVALDVQGLEYVQGFTYKVGIYQLDRHVVRDVAKASGTQELWSGGTHPEMMRFIEAERMRRRLTAALAGRVVVPLPDFYSVLDVADRNEYHPAISRLKALAAAVDGGAK